MAEPRTINRIIDSPHARVLRLGALYSLVALIVFCLAWELWLAPLRPGGSLLALKVVPLLFPLRGVLRGRVYTMQWAAMLVLLYFAEGLVRATSDPGALAWLGWVEAALALVFFVCAVAYVRPHKRAAKQAARQATRLATAHVPERVEAQSEAQAQLQAQVAAPAPAQVAHPAAGLATQPVPKSAIRTDGNQP